jgi:ribonucleoside-diphosphate reductase alpha chain
MSTGSSTQSTVDDRAGNQRAHGGVPPKEIAEQSYRFRTLGLGYANLGAMLMQAGIPYDSDEPAGDLRCHDAILTGRSYATSAEMAGEHGPFPGSTRTATTCCA